MPGIKGDFKFLTTDHPLIVFEDNAVGRLKKQVFDASEEEIDNILKEYNVPSESEIGKPGCYIQTTNRAEVIRKRRINDLERNRQGDSKLSFTATC